MTIAICGASDDLIEVSGDIYEEFGYSGDKAGDLLAFSDGTLLRICFGLVWRITVVRAGAAGLTIVAAPEDDEDNYSDVATLTGDITWVVQGAAYAGLKTNR